MKRLFSSLLASVAILFVLFQTACATTGDENISERPWNAPKDWENGMPTSIMQGR
jgi:hypothetical protein